MSQLSITSTVPSRQVPGSRGSRPQALRLWPCLAALLVLLAGAGLWHAEPAAATPRGATGLINIPTGDVLPGGHVRLGVRLQGAGGPGDGGLAARGAYGLGGRFELGGAATLERAGSFLPALKLQLTPETEETFAAAVGIDGPSLYMVVSRQAGRPELRGHLGFGSGDLQGVFAGLSYLVNPVRVRAEGAPAAPAIYLLAEYDGTSLQGGVRLDFAQGMEATVALQDFEELLVDVGFRTSF